MVNVTSTLKICSLRSAVSTQYRLVTDGRTETGP